MNESTALSKTVLNEIFPYRLTKSDQRRLAILEAAIKTFSNLSLEYVSYEDIARAGKMSRPLVQHHFPKKRELFELAIKLVRGQFQEMAVQAIQKHGHARDQLNAYISSTFDWVQSRPTHGRMWLLYFYFCHGDKKLRQKHKDLTDVGVQRIQALLGSISSSNGQIATDLEFKAKSIQRLITGGLIEVVTETGIEEVSKVRDQVLKACSSLL